MPLSCQIVGVAKLKYFLSWPDRGHRRLDIDIDIDIDIDVDVDIRHRHSTSTWPSHEMRISFSYGKRLEKVDGRWRRENERKSEGRENDRTRGDISSKGCPSTTISRMIVSLCVKTLALPIERLLFQLNDDQKLQPATQYEDENNSAIIRSFEMYFK